MSVPNFVSVQLVDVETFNRISHDSLVIKSVQSFFHLIVVETHHTK